MGRNRLSMTERAVVSVSTDAVRPHEAFDYWRAAFAPVPLERPGGQSGFYRGRYVGLAGADGMVLNDIHCDATRSHFLAGQTDQVLISGLSHGELRARHGYDERTLARPGRLYLTDPVQGSVVESDGHRNIYISAPRALFRNGSADRRKAVEELPDTPLARLLWSHMKVMADEAAGLTRAEAAVAMAAARDMAATLLASADFEDERAVISRRRSLYGAALAFITAHRSRPGLGADAIARAVRCSRAQLYRVFAEQGSSVAEAVRSSRLDHARVLLADARLDLTQIALACGYADASALGKAFRRRFGCSPGDWRAGRTAD